MDKGVWQAMVHGVTKSDTTEATSHAQDKYSVVQMSLLLLFTKMMLKEGEESLVPDGVPCFKMPNLDLFLN